MLTLCSMVLVVLVQLCGGQASVTRDRAAEKCDRNNSILLPTQYLRYQLRAHKHNFTTQLLEEFGNDSSFWIDPKIYQLGSQNGLEFSLMTLFIEEATKFPFIYGNGSISDVNISHNEYLNSNAVGEYSKEILSKFVRSHAIHDQLYWIRNVTVNKEAVEQQCYALEWTSKGRELEEKMQSCSQEKSLLCVNKSALTGRYIQVKLLWVRSSQSTSTPSITASSTASTTSSTTPSITASSTASTTTDKENLMTCKGTIIGSFVVAFVSLVAVITLAVALAIMYQRIRNLEPKQEGEPYTTIAVENQRYDELNIKAARVFVKKSPQLQLSSEQAHKARVSDKKSESSSMVITEEYVLSPEENVDNTSIKEVVNVKVDPVSNDYVLG